jgi:DNA (cytosine-5)-methyltransferase 1
MIKVLNLYCGIGGNRKLWRNAHIVAVEKDRHTAECYKKLFPDDEVIIGDAKEYLLNNFKNFDFIWSSPPCPTHSAIRRCAVKAGKTKPAYPQMDLYQQIILLKHFAPKTSCWIVENVKPYYQPLIEPTKTLHRHFYWCNFQITDFNVTNKRKHNDINGSSTVYGFNITKTNIKDKRKALRNMVDPQLGLHIFNCAKESLGKKRLSQASMF